MTEYVMMTLIICVTIVILAIVYGGFWYADKKHDNSYEEFKTHTQNELKRMQEQCNNLYALCSNNKHK